MKTQLKIIYLLIGLISYNFVYAQEYLVQEVSYKHKPIVEMTINNKKTWVLLDTGSEITILDIKSKDTFGFETYERENLKVPGFGSVNNQLHRAANVDLRFGNTQLRCPMFAFDISNIAESIEARTGKRITAIIGTNVMRMYGFVIDMGKNTVMMHNKAKNNKKKDENKPYMVMKTSESNTKDN